MLPLLSVVHCSLGSPGLVNLNKVLVNLDKVLFETQFVILVLPEIVLKKIGTSF